MKSSEYERIMDAKSRIELAELALKDYVSSSITARELAKKYGLEKNFICGFMLGRGIDIYSKKSKVNNYAFETIDTEEKAYWLGFMYADGSVSAYKSSKRIELSLQEEDKDHLYKFARFLDYRGELKYREKQKAYRIHFGSEKMYRDLIRNGCVEKKSLILTFPSEEIVPKHLQRHFIRGYFDGDGCLSLHLNKSFVFRKNVSILGTKEFLDGIISILPFKPEKADLIKKCRNNDSNNYYFQLRKDDSLKFLDYIYKDSNIYLSRKYLKYITQNGENDFDLW